MPEVHFESACSPPVPLQVERFSDQLAEAVPRSESFLLQFAPNFRSVRQLTALTFHWDLWGSVPQNSDELLLFHECVVCFSIPQFLEYGASNGLLILESEPKEPVFLAQASCFEIHMPSGRLEEGCWHTYLKSSRTEHALASGATLLEPWLWFSNFSFP